MAASSSSSGQQDHNHHHRTGATGHPRNAARHRRPNLNHLQVQVPAVAATNIGCFAGCFRPSPTSSSPAGHGHGQHGDRPASPSLIRSPSAWIRAKGQSFGSGKHTHTRRRSRDFQYDALSYARNFDDSGTDGEGEEEAASDTIKHKCFSSRLPASPPTASPSGLGPGSASGNGKCNEPARGTGRDLDDTI